ncbi:MAG TPA: dienelactone hydrolase family protein [Pyrinomonadaceae bacterium]|nr:dienelactone hydrolase family protein [Chloracidobacterium sp.]MBP9935563.1 dienelactone hydrolase family protein [Pyrinomonadaceae bacterium]MBK7801152.1 dienelactone hydrolase family protein [Chloracidobacterium sp.]MBK9436475.1 dienelactone hydrolase family protein [Chloracidobacterium sp.]MBK9767346.1 dienelactone hydrolase family protein [Chloracidobacterium sp.]
MLTETLTFETAGGPTTAFVAMPDGETGQAVLLIHEWWGLNQHIKDIAGRYAAEGFIAIAPDLYRGSVATNPEDASKMMHALAIEDGLDTIQNTIGAASIRYGISHFGISGYCMGGTFALRAACEVEGISAAAPFYGDVPEDDVLQRLTTPTIFVSGTRDAWINTEKVAALEDAVERFELPLTSVKYDADHAFFNDTRPDVYDETSARDAWALVTGFFRDKL